MSEKIEVGQIVDGKITRIKPFGAIVLLPDNSQGLVHISHVASSYVQDINDFINVDDEVKVKVLSIDPETNKISLSMKEAAPRSGPTEGYYGKPTRAADSNSTFEEKFKEWQKISNERHAGLNKRNKRR